MLKSLPVADMIVNRIAHLFIIHVINNLDDTQLTKKKILNEAVIKIDDYLDDSSYQAVLISALSPLQTEEVDGVVRYKANPFILAEDLACLSF